MTSYKLLDVKNRLLEHATLMGFDYQGVRCGIDPYDDDNYAVFCNGNGTDIMVHSIDEVMNEPYFMGHSLAEIVDEVVFDEW